MLLGSLFLFIEALLLKYSITLAPSFKPSAQRLLWWGGWVGLTIARDFLYIVRSAALGDHHPVTSIEIIQLRLSSPESGNKYRDHPATFIQSSIERIPESPVSSTENTRTEQWDQRNPVSPVLPASPETFTGTSNGYPEQSTGSVTRSVNGYGLLSML